MQGVMGVSRACEAQRLSEVDGAGSADGAAAGCLLQLPSPLVWHCGIALPTVGTVGDVFNTAGWAQYALGVGGVMPLVQLMLRDLNNTCFGEVTMGVLSWWQCLFFLLESLAHHSQGPSQVLVHCKFAFAHPFC